MAPSLADRRSRPRGSRFHAEIYQRRPDIHAIVHTHASWIGRLSVLNRSPRLTSLDAGFLHEKVAVIDGPFASVADAAENQGIVAVIMPHHGAVTNALDLGVAVVLLNPAAQTDVIFGDQPVREMTVDEVAWLINGTTQGGYCDHTWQLLRRRGMRSLSIPIDDS
jgi:hypothetical protein